MTTTRSEHRWWCDRTGDPTAPVNGCNGCDGDTDDQAADDEDLPEGGWACPHHGEFGGPGEHCRGCREHWGDYDPPPAPPVTNRHEKKRELVLAELTRTDAKASALLAALGLPLGVLVVAVPSHDLEPMTTALVMLGGAGLAAAALLALQVLRPVLGPGRPGTWVYWARCSFDELAADLETDHGTEPVQAMAKLTLAKFRRLRWAVDCTAAALVVLAIALASALI
ncbi:MULTISPECIES: Pycsar system effector family protein [Kitasatospora]|uniref:Pycsar system effector family protein n=1 Tax=Kitasatospora TaxID=2063 RepID=UPI000C27DA38|nr:Pycsar system effector family protein [Kitasatospora sp. CB02891]PJN21131.1 hypothetical protein CG736_34890 [Kitasatospora sp. CB02891]